MADATDPGAGPVNEDGGERLEHPVDEEEAQSFPASDPHSDWAGPPG